MTRHFSASLMLAVLISSSVVPASEDDHHHHDEHHNHDAHVHGQAEIYLVIEGAKLFVEIESPAANVFGFEHEPKNDEQSQIVAKAKSTLAQADNVLRIRGGECTLTSSELELPFQGHDLHHHEHTDEPTHTEVEVSYLYECVDSQAVTEIDIQLFENFDGFEEIDVESIIHSKQGSQSLTKKDRLIKL